MSINVDCGGCAAGNHDRHNYAHGLRPGVLGGQHCGCQGDCAERAEVAAAEFLAKWPI